MSHMKKPAKRRHSPAENGKVEAEQQKAVFSQADAIEMFNYLRRISAGIAGEVAFRESTKSFRSNVIKLMNEIDDFVHQMRGRAHANYDMNQR